MKPIILGILTVTLVLTGCSRNPQDKPADEVARLLSNASADAMKFMEIRKQGISEQYARCMEQRTPATFNCAALYQTMAKKLNEQGIAVRTSQIQDRTLYARIKDELQQRSYFSR